jgi:hypothetical protein
MTTTDGTTLEGVSATSLWTLRNRSSEARRFKLVASPLLDRIGRPSMTLLEFGE